MPGWLLALVLAILGSCDDISNINNWKPSSIYLKVRVSKVLTHSSLGPWAWAKYCSGGITGERASSWRMGRRMRNGNLGSRITFKCPAPVIYFLDLPHLPKLLQPLQIASGWDKVFKHRSLWEYICIQPQSSVPFTWVRLPTSLVHTRWMALLPHSQYELNNFHPCPSMP